MPFQTPQCFVEHRLHLGRTERRSGAHGQLAGHVRGEPKLSLQFRRKPEIHAAVAVGTRVSSRAPRTEPYVRLSRIRLPPRVCDGEAIARPRVEDDRFRKPVVRQLRHPCPCDPILLAAKPQRAPPEVDNMDTDDAAGERLASETDHPPPLAE